MRKSLLSVVNVLVLGILLTPASLPGQAATAQINGTITDSSEAAIPAAEVTVTNLGTGIARTTSSNTEGYYTVPLLSPGNYRVSVHKNGFQTVSRAGIVLHVQQVARVDLVLAVGALSEAVSVTADAPLLQSTEASRGQVVDNKKIVDLPLNGREYLQLALLTAGTNVPPPGSRFGGFTSGGLRTSMNNYLLDGMDNNNNHLAAQARTGQVISPSVDAVQEFKVQTSNYSAEYGRQLGAVVSVVIKSGGNDFHGGVFEFLRNEKLDAKNFFDRPNEPTPPLKRNQYGGLLGGPIIKNRTFFFGDYEGTRQRRAATSISTVPTELEKGGDFSRSIFNRLPVQIFDPASYDATTRARQPFASQVIPRSRLDSVTLQVAALYPTPNQPGSVNNYHRNPVDPEDTDKFDVRIDHSFGPRDTIYGRYSRHTFDTVPGGVLPAPAFNAATRSNRGRSFVVSYNRVITPALLNNLRIGYNQLYTLEDVPIRESLTAKFGIKGLAVSPDLPGLGLFATSGFTSVGVSNFPYLSDSQTRQLANDLSWTRHKHTLKTGINLMYIQLPAEQTGRGPGEFTFNGNFTRQSSTNQFGSPFADLLVGIPFNTVVSTTPFGNQRRRSYHAYVQDDYRMTRKLTFNLGVRYEYNGPMFEKWNKYANWDIDTDRANPRIVIAEPGGIASRATVFPDYNNFAPRIGLAYQLGHRTVIRSGYGMYYGGFDHHGGAFLDWMAPHAVESSISTDSITPAFTMQQGLIPGALTNNVANLRTMSQDRRNRTSYSQQWNLTIQRELSTNLSLEVGYAATKGNRLLQRYDTNAPLPGPGNINSRRPVTRTLVPIRDPNLSVSRTPFVTTLGDTFRREWSANSNYHSMQVKVEGRAAPGLFVLASYVWSKTISDARGGSDSGGSGATGAQDVLNLRAEKSLADEHFPHRFVASYNYDLPVGKGRRFLGNPAGIVDAVLGGWSIGGILTLNSGQLVNIGVSGNPSNTGTPNRPNATGQSPLLPKSERSLQRWFNTNAFVINTPFTYGNASRNAVTGPGLANLDFAAYKTFAVRESVRIQLRGEFFNLTNTPFFGSPGGMLGTGQFGIISSAGPGRITQLGLKLNF